MKPRLLIVGMGGGGGIGRYELLLVRTLKGLESAGKLTFSALWRRPHPRYLRTAPHVEDHLATNTTSVGAFALRVLRAAWLARPDIVLFTHVSLARLAPVLSLTRTRPRIVVITHGIDVWTRLDWSRRAGLRAADRVVAVSRYTRGRVIDQQGLPAQRVMAIPLCLEPSWLNGASVRRSPGREVARSESRFRLLTVSRLDVTERAKGIDWVIRALPLVAQAVPDVSYTIVGAGDDLPRLRALASASGVADRIEFKGALEHDELIGEYSSCDIFVLPSAKEGFGLVFLEAMAFEKPVVARAARAVSEVVEDGETGVLVRDEPELAPALIGLLGDRERASRMGTAGRRRLAAEFSLERFEDRMAALIEEVSALSGPASQRVRWLGRD